MTLPCVDFINVIMGDVPKVESGTHCVTLSFALRLLQNVNIIKRMRLRPRKDPFNSFNRKFVLTMLLSVVTMYLN